MICRHDRIITCCVLLSGYLVLLCQAENSLRNTVPSRRALQTKNSNGPWPECLGMQGEDCVSYIESQAEDVYCLIVYPLEYDYHRVWIHVDVKDIVTEAPSRG